MDKMFTAVLLWQSSVSERTGPPPTPIPNWVAEAYIVFVWVCLMFIAGLLLLVLWNTARGVIDISQLIHEAGENVSRFQMLIFTTVFAMIVFIVTIGRYPPSFPDVPVGFIYFMGASYGVYFLDKGLSSIKRRPKSNREDASEFSSEK